MGLKGPPLNAPVIASRLLSLREEYGSLSACQRMPSALPPPLCPAAWCVTSPCNLVPTTQAPVVRKNKKQCGFLSVALKWEPNIKPQQQAQAQQAMPYAYGAPPPGMYGQPGMYSQPQGGGYYPPPQGYQQQQQPQQPQQYYGQPPPGAYQPYTGYPPRG